MDDRDERAQYRKKRVAVIKKAIIITIIVFILLPTVLCIILFIRMNQMQKQLNMVLERQQEEVAMQAADKLAANEQTMDGALYNENVDTQELKSQPGSMKPHVVPDDEKYQGKKVYLTFDDGPSDNTDLILDKLAEYNVKATFFVVLKTDDESVARYNRIVNEGHTLAMHSATHVYSQIYNSMEDYIADVSQLRDYIETVTQLRPEFYRFPGGSSNLVSNVPIQDCIEYLDEQEIVYFDWNVASGDADRNNVQPSLIASNVINGIEQKDVSVVLMHDTNSKSTTVAALDSILTYLAETGASVLPITEGTTPVHHRLSK